jgi:hypothetical protein
VRAIEMGAAVFLTQSAQRTRRTGAGEKTKTLA